MSQSLSQMINILKEYKFDFSSLPDRLKCILCHEILQNSKQTLCVCKVCDECIESYLSHGPKTYPSNQLDRMKVKLNLNEDIYPDNASNKEIANFVMKCQFYPCSHRCPLRNMVGHINSCRFQRIICGKCGIKIMTKEKVNHDQKKCELRIVKCDYCSLTMSYKKLISIHLNADTDELCSKFVGICPNNCNEIHKINLKEHLKICSNQKLECIFHRFDCKIDKMTKKELKKHMEEEYLNKTSSLMNKIETVETENYNLKSELTKNICINKELFEMCKKFSVFGLIIDKTKNELMRKGVISTIQTVDNENKISRFMSCVWQLRDFKMCQKCAESGERELVTSGPFYTSELGYKIRLCVYPVGTGVGKGTHLSVFFTIMRGEFDDLLPWPFKMKVILSILNQESGGEDHSYIIQTDSELECFQKPTEEFNISSGCARFVCLSLMTDNSMYCKHGTIQIKITVHELGNSKPQHILS